MLPGWPPAAWIALCPQHGNVVCLLWNVRVVLLERLWALPALDKLSQGSHRHPRPSDHRRAAPLAWIDLDVLLTQAHVVKRPFGHIGGEIALAGFRPTIQFRTSRLNLIERLIGSSESSASAAASSAASNVRPRCRRAFATRCSSALFTALIETPLISAISFLVRSGESFIRGAIKSVPRKAQITCPFGWNLTSCDSGCGLDADGIVNRADQSVDCFGQPGRAREETIAFPDLLAGE